MTEEEKDKFVVEVDDFVWEKPKSKEQISRESENKEDKPEEEK